MKIFHLPKPKNRLKFEPEKKQWFKKPFDKKSRLRSSQQWQDLREFLLFENPLCKLCNSAAFEIHHIDGGKDETFFQRDNLVSLCEDCHKKVHAAYRRGIEPETIFGANNGRN